MRTLLIAIVSVAAAAVAHAQDAPPATVLSASHIDAVLKKSVEGNIVDQLVGDLDVAGHKIALAMLRRIKPETNGLIHSHVTEIYQIVRGSGTLTTGGTLKGAKPNDLARVAAGVGLSGVHEGGEARRVGPGDVVIVPQGTPHRFSQLDGEIVYLTYRFDSQKK
jgi:glc operon protein GlcG